jgi:hypothetical protein
MAAVMNIHTHTREQWLADLRARRAKHPGSYFCFCSGHCPESPYHDKSCCEDWCGCLCHLDKEEAKRV